MKRSERVLTIPGVQYRLCLSADSAFPAPLLDALAGYLYLTRTLHFDPPDIILLGDSSGAHLALTLSRYLSDLGLCQPGYVALSSPLGDCGRSMPSRWKLSGVDILASNMDAKPLRSALRHYTPQALDHPYFAPAKAAPSDWEYLRVAGVKVYVMIGTKEILMDDGFAIVKAMQEAKVDVEVREVSYVRGALAVLMDIGPRRESLWRYGSVERVKCMGSLGARSASIGWDRRMSRSPGSTELLASATFRLPTAVSCSKVRVVYTP
jgi:acetyl esterase/lipase